MDYQKIEHISAEDAFSQGNEKSVRDKMGHYISEIIYGANDGIITTFAVVAGATGAGLSTGVILILGVASLFADGFSMGTSKYLALRSEQDYEGTKDRVIDRHALKDGSATFLAFIVAGVLPLIPFFFGIAQERQFIVSAIATALALFFVGAGRVFFTKKSFFGSGFEMLFVGGLAAFIAYGAGWGVERLFLQ